MNHHLTLIFILLNDASKISKFIILS